MKLLNWVVILCVVESHVVAQEATADKKAAPAKGQVTESTKVLAEEDKSQPVLIELADGTVVLEAPKEWKRVEPRFPQMVQYEFSAPANAKEGEPTVRITVMASGGGLDGNLQRWYGQFTQPDGKATKDVAKIEEFEVDGQTFHFVNITGTYAGGMGRPGAPPQPPKENHQLTSGIISTPKHGMFFITATGPIAENEKLTEGFLEMLKHAKIKK